MSDFSIFKAYKDKSVIAIAHILCYPRVQILHDPPYKYGAYRLFAISIKTACGNWML
jgi:hypothetical protein